MKVSKKNLLLPLLLLVGMSQTGCMIAAPTALLLAGPAAAGAFFGSGIAITGIGAAYSAFFGREGHNGDIINPDQYETGQFIIGIGFFLDGKNPGRSEALNPLPVDAKLAKKLDVSVEELALYNDELDQIHKTNVRVEAGLKQVLKGKMNDKQADELARSLGFKDARDLGDTLRSDKLKAEKLEAFARSQELRTSTARIYLQQRFGAKL